MFKWGSLPSFSHHALWDKRAIRVKNVAAAPLQNIPYPMYCLALESLLFQLKTNTHMQYSVCPVVLVFLVFPVGTSCSLFWTITWPEDMAEDCKLKKNVGNANYIIAFHACTDVLGNLQLNSVAQEQAYCSSLHEQNAEWPWNQIIPYSIDFMAGENKKECLIQPLCLMIQFFWPERLLAREKVKLISEARRKWKMFLFRLDLNVSSQEVKDV